MTRSDSTRANQQPDATAGTVTPSAHSALPWRLNGAWTGIISGVNAPALLDKYARVEDLEFIVRAVNNHEALLSALKGAHEFMLNINAPVPDDVFDAAEAAIAKVEGREP